MHYFYFVALTIFCWGTYGVLLHMGQIELNDDRYKAFFVVGLAYFLVAVLAPSVLLVKGGSDWKFTLDGFVLSLMAGTVGAFGAFGVLLAFGHGGKPAVVMSLIFAGAPIVNAIVSFLVHPPAGGLSTIRWQFIAGIFLAAAGAYLVVTFKPMDKKPVLNPDEAVQKTSGQASGKA